jgi:hypothetical protein
MRMAPALTARVRTDRVVRAGRSVGCREMASSHISPRGRVLLIAVLAALSLAALLATGFDIGLMMLLPALVTAVLMIVWPYPGLELILRIATRRRPRPGRARAVRRRRPIVVARGGRLIAASLGGRAPPVLAVRA